MGFVLLCREERARAAEVTRLLVSRAHVRSRRRPARRASSPPSPASGFAFRTRSGVVHLQLRRFAGCPICHLHLRSFVRRHAEIAAAGIREVVVFHSPAEELAPHASGFPFPLVADPEKRLYAELGVESSPRALLDPRAWLPIAARGHGRHRWRC